MNASISRDGDIVVGNVDVSVHITRRSGLLEWSGSFQITHKIVFDDDEYTLKLADGRSGRILITDQGIAGGSPTKRVRFQGTGPLQ